MLLLLILIFLSTDACIRIFWKAHMPSPHSFSCSYIIQLELMTRLAPFFMAILISMCSSGSPFMAFNDFQAAPTQLLIHTYVRAVHVIAHMLHPGQCWSWSWSWSWTLMIFPHPRIYINIDEFIARWPRTLISSKKLICGGVFTHFLIFWTNMLVVCCLLYGIHFSAEGIFSPDLGLGRGRRK